MKDSWKKKFAIIWIGQFISLISTSAVNFAVVIWLSLKTGSAEVLAYSAMASLLPQAIIGPIAGVFIDRWDRKKTMIFADAFVAICTLFMSISFYMGYESLILIYVILALRSVGSAFHMPAMQAAIPMLAPESELLRIAGINQTIQSASSIAGPALGALAISWFSIGNVLLLDIIGAIVAIVALLFVVIPNPQLAEKSKTSFNQVWQDIRLGFHEILRNKGLSWLFLYSIIATFCIMPVAVMFPLLTLNHFGGGKFEMSLIEIVWGVGMLIGGGILGLWKPSTSKVVLINCMHIILGATLAFSGWISASAFVTFVGLTTLGGLAASIYQASFMTVLQEQIRPDMMGRVFSMYFSFAIIPSVIGLLSTGFVADTIGVNLTFIILGLLIVLVGILSFFTPALMGLNRKKELSENVHSADNN
ncbi:major facilitator superfamily MFS_1 [Pseudopedobacter saltans DSM 12145]|uniref:Major facilitator superfamily MFS_1 n=1 Tax=Pseudopedobacter saltans (strain ATCC 51119 / DSM 12145 / JCM 21818 / CCUG 39354 / LMG 10337 / NBRC 100064 / NCIMB 13643) TaxID=762903 RepID=F0S6L5_PSESL|nr:MFS transporter [Pseudopedobacter saltans]ADY51091.1 major facilitator superfamily MFS_1 [Pseudopedobacter saltans DSM 12145]